MANTFKNFWNKNRKLTALSAVIPVIILLIFKTPFGCKAACAYMYLIAPFVLLPLLGYKFEKTADVKKKDSILWQMNNVTYDEKKLNSLARKIVLIMVLSIFVTGHFNKLGLHFIETLDFAVPYLLMHVFFFVTGEPLSAIKVIFHASLRNGSSAISSSSSDAFSSRTHNRNIFDSSPSSTTTRVFLHDGNFVRRTFNE